MIHNNQIFRITARTVGVLAIVSALACSSKKTKEDESYIPRAPGSEIIDESATSGDSDSGRAMGLQTVHYPFDSHTLDDQAKRALKANADIMKDKKNLRVQIEGHCDQRGGIQYNIALGERRANSARGYLMDLGVSGDRISVISYGKEKPIDPAMTDEAYAKNRRANFVITAR